MDLVDDAARALEAMSGIPLETCKVERGGFLGRGVRTSGIEEGKGVTVALTITASCVEASAFPEATAGSLVRRFWHYADAHEENIALAIKDLQADGIAVVMSVNERIVDVPGIAVDDERWWAVEIECRKRLIGRQREAAKEDLIEVGATALSLILSALEQTAQGDSESDVEHAIEGTATIQAQTRYERSPANRMRCIAHYGAKCAICGFDFGDSYGVVGAGFIEVHHVVPVSTMAAPTMVDPFRDLIPLCCNCHAIVHRRSPPYEPKEVKRFLTGST